MRKIYLLTNNQQDYPVLIGQLLKLYAEMDAEIILFCKKPKTESDKNGIKCVYTDKYNWNFINYLYYIYLLSLIPIDKEAVFHIRGFVSSVIFSLANIFGLPRVNYIYDPRGLFIDERVESGSPLAFLTRPLRWIESRVIKYSMSTIVTTEKFSNVLTESYGYAEKYKVMYNCTSSDFRARKVALASSDELNVCYLGTFNYWHDINELENIVLRLIKIFPGKVNLFVATSIKFHDMVNESFGKLGLSRLVVSYVPYDQIPVFLSDMDVGISMVKPTKTGIVASPIKVSDYLASSVIMILNKDIGDFDDHYRLHNSAILYNYGLPDFSFSDLESVESGKNARLYQLSNATFNKKILCSLIG